MIEETFILKDKDDENQNSDNDNNDNRRVRDDDSWQERSDNPDIIM